MTQVALVAPDQILHVRDEKTAGTSAGTSLTGDNIRVLNTVARNTISGASLGSNQITLPLGTYTVNASAPALQSGYHKLRLVNVTDSTNVLIGQSCYSAAASVVQTTSTILGVFTLAATKVLNLTHYIAGGSAPNGLGGGTGILTEVYAEVFITKIA